MNNGGGLPRILCVDDEPRVLKGLTKITFDHFDVVTAESGEEGLQKIETEGPFVIIVSDMKMPGMDGAAFLAEANKLAPTTVRILLTGQADVEAAIAAVNKGRIYRFLCKPITKEDMLIALYDAADQYQLLKGEKDLLEETLNGTVKMLIDILDLAAPQAFSRANRIKRYVIYMARQLDCGVKWQFTLAAMLSHIGAITLPPRTLARYYDGKELSPDERKMIGEMAETGFALLRKIPRLTAVAEIVKRQRDDFDPGETNLISIGAHLLKVAVDLDREVGGGKSIWNAVSALKAEKGAYDTALLDLMKDYQQVGYGESVKSVAVKDLAVGMTVDEDVLTSDGDVLVGKGGRINTVMLDRLRNYSRDVGVKEPIRVVEMA